MRKCPDCAEVNINESLFCKQCGRCLLAPNPEEIQWIIPTPTKYHKTREGIEFYERHIVKKSRVASLQRRHLTAPSVKEGWLLLLNLLVFIVLFEIVRYIFSG